MNRAPAGGRWAPGARKHVRSIGRLDLPGGGQVVVRDGLAFVGHMDPPHGTSIVDVSDPKHPRVVAAIPAPLGGMSHKVRVRDDGVMFANAQTIPGQPADPNFTPGLRIFDVSKPAVPRQLAFWRCAGVGVHRFDIDDRFAYLAAEVEGYRGRIVVVLDVEDPVNPREAGRWWLPGQWTAGGEEPTWEGQGHSCHLPLKFGDRLYIAYWHAGIIILNIADLSHPQFVSRLDWSPPYPCPTHTALRIPWKLAGRDFLLCTDEEVTDRLARWPAAFMWMVDVTDERNPIPVSTFRGPDNPDFPPGEGFGAHQPQEQLYDRNVIAVTWFGGGLRFVDISDPYSPTEVGYYVPRPRSGQDRVMSNDVCVSPDGLLYLLDRADGLEILEYTGGAR
jgi:hypothetical protein